MIIKSENKISNISENLHITGTVISTGKISFNGRIKGSLESKSLYVGKNGFIDGKVEADEAVILGRIKGTLKGNKVRLAASSRIEGDTYHQVIAIEDGAIYEGSIKRIKIVNYRPLILGSKASLKPSPRKFILKTVKDIARPGHITLSG